MCKKMYVLILVLISLFIGSSNVLAYENIYYNETSENKQSIYLDDYNVTLNIFAGTMNYQSEDIVYISGNAHNPDYRNDIINMKIYFYDKGNNLIGNNNYSLKLLGKGYSNVSVFTSLKESQLLNGKKTDDVAYYSISIVSIVDELDNNIINDIDDNSTDITNNTNSTMTLPETSITPSKNSSYKYYDYVIDNYDINVIVNENNTFDITEKITAYFNVSRHGIYRTIPLKNTITRLDGTKSTNRAQISNLSVDNEYTTSKENSNYKIQIGSVATTLTGEQQYTISYTYNIGKDPMDEYDELYLNLIGTEWDTVIGNVTFTITMPKDFDESLLGFSSGTTGSTNNSNITYTVDGNIITGKYNGILDEGEALTVRCELPEGYFVGAGLVYNPIDYIWYIFPIIFLVISIFLWYKYGRDDQVVETVEFYPPEGFNSLEIGFLYKGEANNQDVTSLLIYLANKGYLKITESEEKTLFSTKQSFKITKLKEYDGNNINEKIFFNKLFTKGLAFDFTKPLIDVYNDVNIEQNIEEVTPSDLYNSFYQTINVILKNINSKENKNQIFEKVTSGKTKYIILMIIATYCLITIPTIGLTPAILFMGIGFTFMFKFLFGKTQTIYVNGKPTNSSIGTKLFGLIWGIGFGGIPWALMILPSFDDNLHLIGHFVGLICVMGMVICWTYLPKRTQYGNQILGRIKGFKNFLETAEKDKLEAMVMQNPTYFYDILPYTYVLGVSDKWISKFETISMQAPSWYDSSSGFNTIAFGTFMQTTMASANSAMSSSPSSSSGGSSGGGSSGGGSGGGGGGSW